MKFIFAQNDCRVKAEEVLSLLKRYMDIEIDMEKSTTLSSIVEVWEVLEKFMLS